MALAAFVYASPAAADVIAKPRGIAPASATSQLIDAISRKSLPGSTRVVELTGSSSGDAALLLREGSAGGTMYAVGPDAVVAAKGLERTVSIVALNVPNPDRLGTAATYVSVYPKFDNVIRFISRMKGRTAGILFTPSQNHEVAVRLASSAKAAGLTPMPVPVSGTNAATVLRDKLAKMDVLILLIDPLLFDAKTLNAVVSLATAAHVATIGFLPELTDLGVTVAVVPPVEALASMALRNGRTTAARHTVEVEEMEVTVSKKSAQEVGLDTSLIGPHSLR